eukprot:TRINITY_DN2500_c0_g1_i5.p1 TRINITY_DN2500_c0_g1~~TRINITY_DN2500_c0_g1_i5.p1  ORF type:complete len:222 (+),score=59.69 TRINITY_DN2500_c0_g1_i5:664-1329(+)
MPSNQYRSKGLWALKTKNGGKWPAAKEAAAPATSKTIVKDFGKGQKRTVVVPRSPRFYPTEKVTKPRALRRKASAPTIRESLQVGTVAIVLSGKFRGKRVIVIDRLASGLVLVSGPFKVNGVPLRRYNPAYLIATSTKVDLSSVKFENADKLNDAFFARPANSEDKSANVENKKVTADRIALQKSVDTQLLAVVKKTPFLKEYLASRFTITKGLNPHALKF